MNEEEKQGIKFLEEYIRALTYPNPFIYSREEKIEGLKKVINLIKKQQKEIEQMKSKINKIILMIKENYHSDFYDDYETIVGLRDDIYNLLTKI